MAARLRTRPVYRARCTSPICQLAFVVGVAPVHGQHVRRDDAAYGGTNAPFAVHRTRRRSRLRWTSATYLPGTISRRFAAARWLTAAIARHDTPWKLCRWHGKPNESTGVVSKPEACGSQFVLTKALFAPHRYEGSRMSAIDSKYNHASRSQPPQCIRESPPGRRLSHSQACPPSPRRGPASSRVFNRVADRIALVSPHCVRGARVCVNFIQQASRSDRFSWCLQGMGNCAQ